MLKKIIWSINHETAFQEYLEYYFGFRKAYCDLRIIYKPVIIIPVKVLYCFRNVLAKLDNIGIIHFINSVLKMEGIARSSLRNKERVYEK